MNQGFRRAGRQTLEQHCRGIDQQVRRGIPHAAVQAYAAHRPQHGADGGAGPFRTPAAGSGEAGAQGGAASEKRHPAQEPASQEPGGQGRRTFPPLPQLFHGRIQEGRPQHREPVPYVPMIHFLASRFCSCSSTYFRRLLK